jgi:hypothetical protein
VLLALLAVSVVEPSSVEMSGVEAKPGSRNNFAPSAHLCGQFAPGKCQDKVAAKSRKMRKKKQKHKS